MECIPNTMSNDDDTSANSQEDIESPPEMTQDSPDSSPEINFQDSWAKIKEISGLIHRAADEALKRGYAMDTTKLESRAQELVTLLQQVGEHEPPIKRCRLPPPLIRPRRHRKRCEGSPDKKITDSQLQKKKLNSILNMYCHSCGTTDTVEWRRGPDGTKSLCNACGLHYAKMMKREMMVPNRQPQPNVMSLTNLLE